MAFVSLRFKVKSNTIPAVAAKIPIAADRSVNRSADDLQSEWRDRMWEAPRGGNVYDIVDVHGVAREHKASAPGEVPAVMNSFYLDSIEVVRVGNAHYLVGTDIEYAEELEFGSIRVSPRPVAGPLANHFMGQFVWNMVTDMDWM